MDPGPVGCSTAGAMLSKCPRPPLLVFPGRLFTREKCHLFRPAFISLSVPLRLPGLFRFQGPARRPEACSWFALEDKSNNFRVALALGLFRRRSIEEGTDVPAPVGAKARNLQRLPIVQPTPRWPAYNCHAAKLPVSICPDAPLVSDCSIVMSVILDHKGIRLCQADRPRLQAHSSAHLSPFPPYSVEKMLIRPFPKKYRKSGPNTRPSPLW